MTVWRNTFGRLLVVLCLPVAALAADLRTLRIYNFAEYSAEDTIRSFEKETGIKVQYDTYNTNEVLLSRLAIGNSGYDIVVLSADFAKSLIDSGSFQRIDRTKLTNWSNLDPDILHQMALFDPGNQYLVNWLWGYTTIAINATRLQAALGGLAMPEDPWRLVFDPAYASRAKSCGIGVVDSASTIIPLALRFMGLPPFSLKPAVYAEVAELLRQVRPYIAHFSADDNSERLAEGKLCVVVGHSGDLAQARKRAQQRNKAEVVEVVIRNAGAIQFFHSMAIPHDAANPDAAHRFINYILRPEVHAALTNKLLHANPNKASRRYISAEVASDPVVYPDPAQLRGMLVPEPLPDNIRRLQIRTFTGFKFGWY